jgi:hypothetical protein
MRYVIRVQGHLDPSWQARFEKLAIAHEPGGTTRLSGPLADQAALYGVLATMRDRGLTLLSVESSAPAQQTVN